MALTMAAATLATAAQADVLAMPEGSIAYEGPVPARGRSMAEVQQQFGAPERKHPAVGGGAPQRPPITRWDYEGFSVFFEKDLVVDTVIPGRSVPIAHRDQLRNLEAR